MPALGTLQLARLKTARHVVPAFGTTKPALTSVAPQAPAQQTDSCDKQSNSDGAYEPKEHGIILR